MNYTCTCISANDNLNSKQLLEKNLGSQSSFQEAYIVRDKC